jgi:hypothetical protein
MAAQTNAQRQAAFRERHLRGADAPKAMLNVVIPSSAKDTLKRLTRCYRITQDRLLTDLLRDEQESLLPMLSEKQRKRYLEDVTG